MKKLVIITLLSVVYVMAFGQKSKDVNAKLFMINGSVLEGTVQMPVKSDGAKISFVHSGTGKRESIKNDEVEFMMLTRDDKSILLKRSYFKDYKLSRTAKVSKYKLWLSVQKNCENFVSYLLVAEFDINKKGKFLDVYLDGMGKYLVQRIGEEHPTTVGFVFLNKPVSFGTFDKSRAEMLDIYFGKDSEYVSHFKGADKVTHDELLKFLEEYCK